MTVDDYLLMRDGYATEIQRLEKLLAAFTRKRKYKTIVDREREPKNGSRNISLCCGSADKQSMRLIKYCKKWGRANDKFRNLYISKI